MLFLKFRKTGGTTITDWLASALHTDDCSRQTRASCSLPKKQLEEGCSLKTRVLSMAGSAHGCIGNNALRAWRNKQSADRAS